jgi:glycosyltransferase involved in cell wall biosynthesis/SAM-dependent methyltransferase
MLACTIIARNYLAQARILARSFAEQVPDGRMVVLVLDPDPSSPLTGEPFEVLTPHDIMSPVEFGQMATMYTVVELATGVKPWLLEHLLAQAPAVSYFDPDIEFFSDPRFIDRLACEHGAVLTPHAIEPLPRGDALTPGEDVILSAGIYNLGFVSVGGEMGLAVTQWWQSRLRRECIISPTSWRFVDQRWMDLAPAYFAPYILRHPGCNVAWWNLPNRDVRERDGRWTVNGEDLVFFHFSGYDPRKSHLVSKHQGVAPRVLLSQRPDLARLFAQYDAKMLTEGHAANSAIPYGVNEVDGLVLDRVMRDLFRDALLEAEDKGSAVPPNPFSDGAPAFVAWLSEPGPGLADSRAPGRYLMNVYVRTPDLRERFPGVPGPDTGIFEQYVRDVMVPDGMIPAQLAPARVPEVPMAAAPTEGLQPGVNVIAYFTAESGVGQAARLMLAGIDAAGIPHATVTYDTAPGRSTHEFSEHGVDKAIYDTNLVCVNADVIRTANHWMGERLRDHRYRIGLWWWETSTFPEMFDPSFDVVDEVWVGSAFVGDAIRQRTDKPVTVIPMPIVVPPAVGGARAAVGVTEDTFLVLYSYDFDSVFARKNPLGALNAYTSAFAADDGCTLLLKSINGERHLEELEELRMAAAGRPDVVVLDQYLDATTNRGLIAECDCYLSLHRSEGFGLTIAEAMAYARPVVATAYSANLEFMDDTTGYLVPTNEGVVPAGAGPYPAGTTWGEPDIAAASSLLAHVRHNPDEARAKALAAAEYIRVERSPEKTGGVIKTRLDAIWTATPRSAPQHDAGSVTDRRRIEELDQRMREGGLTPWRTGSSGPRAIAHRGLLRALQPYLQRRGEIDEVLMQVLAELDLRCSDLEGQQRVLEARVQAMAEAAERSAAALARRLDDVSATTQRIDWELSAPMYMRDPDEFTIDQDGRPVMGYRETGDAHSDEDLYRQFEEVFRGPAAMIREMQMPYVGMFPAEGLIADIGCGRGEFLDLLRESGRGALGVDSDAGMLADARARGHASAVLADGITWLEERAPSSLQGVFAAQVIEHLSYDEFLRFLRAARRALTTDGVLIAETINPHFIPAFRAFWVDLTHKLVIYPEVALALTRLTGFRTARVVFPGGTGDVGMDRRQVGQFAVVASPGLAVGTMAP